MECNAVRGCHGRGGAAGRTRPRVRFGWIGIGAHQLGNPPCRCRRPVSVAECCVIKDYIKRLSSVAMAASAASASLPEPRALEELSLTPPSSLPGRGGLRTEAASNCIDKLIAYEQASDPGFQGLRGDESRRGVKHAHAQPRRPRLSPGDSPGDARAHAQSAPLRGARSPPFPSVHTFFWTL